MRMFPFLALTLFTLAKAVPQATSSTGNDCVGTISSLGDVDTAARCSTVNIEGFIVPAGQTFNLDLLQGTTVNVLGDIHFGNETWSGPLFQVSGENVTFNGNGHVWDGGGPFYWDGLGGSGGVTKPSPMMRILMSGSISDIYVRNSPERCFAISTSGPLVVSEAVVDDSQGALPNVNSKGLPAGRNTDAFDVAGQDIVIKNSVAINQDDCLAINWGTNIIFEDNYCDSGHGISIGSISSDVVVEDIVIQGNTVINSTIAFRIKTQATATNSRVSNITYSHNTARNCADYGVVVTQSYPDTTGTPGNGVIISDINFSATEVSVSNDADTLILNCGQDSCNGRWDLSGLKIDGGKGVGMVKNYPELTGYTL